MVRCVADDRDGDGMSVVEKTAPIGDKLSERELCPDDLLAGQEAAFARDIARLHKRADEFAIVACPACGKANQDKAFEKFGFTFRRCEQCATIYMSPRPSPAVLADYYARSENYDYWAKYIFPASEAIRREKIHRPWLDRVVDFCDRHGIKRGVLAEVGAGFGTFAALATQAASFDRVVVIEPTPEMASACRFRGVEVIEKRIEDVGDELGSANVIVSFEVIEHLFEPRVFLEQCARLLNSGGLLVLSCPNGCGFDIAMLGAKSLAVDAEHLNLFNPGALTHLLEACGFEVLQATTPGRLDAEFVREAALKGEIDLSNDPFLNARWSMNGTGSVGRFSDFLPKTVCRRTCGSRRGGNENAQVTDSQRTRTKSAVKSCYSTWADSYYADYFANPDAYPPVHQNLIRDLLSRSNARTVIDAGCGPASMLRNLVDLNLDLYGFDLTPEMVSTARGVMSVSGLAPEHLWEGSVADASAFRRPGVTPDTFDAAICIGVLPHVPEGVEQEAMVNLRNAVKPGGLVAVEARNQFFGLFTLNRYSYEFFVEELIRRSALAVAGVDAAMLTSALDQMQDRFRMDLPPTRKGKSREPGYDQVLSRTHNPITLKQKFEAAGFENIRTSFLSLSLPATDVRTVDAGPIP